MAGSIIGDVAGSVVGGLFGAKGDRKASDQAFNAARQSQQIFRPQIPQAGNNNVFGNILPSGHFSANPLGQQVQADLIRKFRTFSGQFDDFNKGDFANRFFDSIDRLESRREAQGFADLESRLFNRRGVNTGTQRQVADFQRDIEDARLSRVINAELAGDIRSRGMFQDFINALGGLQGFGNNIQSQRNSAVQNASLMRPFAINNPAIGNAGLLQAGNTQSFFDSLGGGLANATNAGVSTLFGGGFSNPFSSGGGFFNPSAVNFSGANPFNTFQGLG